MMMRLLLRIGLAHSTLAVLFAAGCGKENGTGAAGRTNPSTQSAAVLPEIKIQPLLQAKYDDMIREHNGKVLVVDFWFKGCHPCELALPHLAAMQKRYGAKDLSVVTIDVEEADNPEGRAGAVKFLNDKQITLTNYVTSDQEEAKVWFDKLQLGGFPTTMIYDREGKRVERFEGGNVKEIEEAVAKLIKQKG
jgi:thiol-disulfide isomerase/thioredoxin